jgi:hypothetical protein
VAQGKINLHPFTGVAQVQFFLGVQSQEFLKKINKFIVLPIKSHNEARVENH